jgi:hypothetical protein
VVVLSPLDASGVGNLESEIYSSKVFKESSHQALSNGVEGVENKSVSFMIHSFFFFYPSICLSSLFSHAILAL